jgi:hypothetical protein
MLKQFFDISTGFRFSKLQWGSVPSIPVAVLDHPLCDVWKQKTQILIAHQKEDIDGTKKVRLAAKKSSARV